MFGTKLGVVVPGFFRPHALIIICQNAHTRADAVGQSRSRPRQAEASAAARGIIRRQKEEEMGRMGEDGEPRVGADVTRGRRLGIQPGHAVDQPD